MRKYLLFFINIFILTNISAQEQQYVKLTQQEIEAQFLHQNLKLLAEQLNVSIADASIAQAKLWENPTFSLGELNLWSTETQRRQEQIPPLFGNFAKNTEFTLELSQLVQTARKRGKLINREKVSKEIIIQEFEETLRGLKLELRKSLQEIKYLQSYQEILQRQETSLRKLTEAYKNQVGQGNIAKKELIRLQASLLELNSEIHEVKTGFNEQQKNLKVLLNAPPFIIIEIQDENEEIKNPENIFLSRLLAVASESRPEIRKANLQIEYFERSLSYEKAQRVPDLTFSVGYDRIGNAWRDFIGVGLSVDLPFFNRNQGNIKIAQIEKDKSQYKAQQQMNLIQQEVMEAYNNYYLTYLFYKEIEDENLSEDLDFMLDAYTRNLMNRNISMIEFMDFMEAFRINKETMLSTRKKLYTWFEELQYSVGSEIN